METITPTVAKRSAGMLSKVFEGEPSDFQSPLSGAQALAQLQELTKWRPGKLSLVGAVSADTIELRIAHVFRRGNGTRFQGHLLARGEGSSLVGSFKSSDYSRFVTAIFLVFLGLMLLGGLVGGLYQAFTQASSLFNAMRIIGFLLLWVAGVCLMGWLVVWNGSPERNDVLVISTAIRHALQESGT